MSGFGFHVSVIGTACPGLRSCKRYATPVSPCAILPSRSNTAIRPGKSRYPTTRRNWHSATTKLEPTQSRRSRTARRAYRSPLSQTTSSSMIISSRRFLASWRRGETPCRSSWAISAKGSTIWMVPGFSARWERNCSIAFHFSYALSVQFARELINGCLAGTRGTSASVK